MFVMTLLLPVVYPATIIKSISRIPAVNMSDVYLNEESPDTNTGTSAILFVGFASGANDFLTILDINFTQNGTIPDSSTINWCVS